MYQQKAVYLENIMADTRYTYKPKNFNGKSE